MKNKIVAESRNEVVITGLKKNFGDVLAVNGLDLEIKKGELFGFLGYQKEKI